MPTEIDIEKAILQYLAECKGAGVAGIRRRFRKRFPITRIPDDVTRVLGSMLQSGTIKRAGNLYCLPEHAMSLEERHSCEARSSSAPRKVGAAVTWEWADGRVEQISPRHAKKLELHGFLNRAQPMPRPELKYTSAPGRKRETPIQKLPPEEATDIRTLGLPRHNWLVDD